MCSVFRRRIANQIITRLTPFLIGHEKVYLYDSLPLCIKFNQSKSSPPNFEISWKDIVKLKPDLSCRVHPASLFTHLKNQDFPTQDGFINISHQQGTQEKFIFTTDQELLTSSVLLNTASSIEEIPLRSTFFRNVPPEFVLVEYSSPNIAKPFHFGHFRSTIVGNFLANICQYVGHDVIRINYIGDWGVQYGILAAGFTEFGSDEKLAHGPLEHLYEVYKDANAKSEKDTNFNEKAKELFKRMEEGDTEMLEQWRRLRDISLEKMDETYRRLKIKFDDIQSESMFFEKANGILAELVKKGLAQCKEDGSIHADINTGKKESIVLRKSDGTSLYLTRKNISENLLKPPISSMLTPEDTHSKDLAAAIDRHKKYHFDSMYYVVDSTQQKHFVYLKSILKSLGFSWERNVHHVPFGRVLNFSSRKGNAVFLHDILNEAQERTLERMKNSPNTKVSENVDAVAEVLGISSLIISDFSCKRKRDTQFSWDKVLSMTEDSGISLQYCHARLCSIQENCGLEVNTDCELSPLVEPEAVSLITHLAKFEEVIYNAYVSMEPCIIVHYLFALRNEVGRAIRVLNVKGSSPYVARARLLLFHSAQVVLRKSFQLLGITPLSKM